MLVPDISHLFWEYFTRSSRKLKTCTVRNALKLRHGTFWNAKLARHFQKPYLGKTSDGKCPLCRNPDSGTTGTHGLGACTYRLVKGLYIERHNEAVAYAGKAIMKGANGGCLALLMADAGWHGKFTGLSVESRIPSQVMKDVPESMHGRMRPDMLLIEKHTGDGVNGVLPTLHDLEHPRHRRCCRVHLVEVGFCAEVAYAQNHKEKYKQHRALLDLVRTADSADVQLHLLIFSSTGGMFRLTALHLKRLGVSHSKVDRLLQDMHWKALRRLEQIIGTRSKLERSSTIAAKESNAGHLPTSVNMGHNQGGAWCAR